MTSPSMHILVPGMAFAGSTGIGYAIGTQPHKNESIGFLQSALGELIATTPNEGSYRERAIILIDQAIGEIRAGVTSAGGQASLKRGPNAPSTPAGEQP